MSARDDILGRIRIATGRPKGAGPPPPPEYANQALIPARAQGTPAELTERFVEMATEADISIDRVSHAGEVAEGFEDSPEYALYGYLSWLLEWCVRALTGT